MADAADIANDLVIERIEQIIAGRRPLNGGASVEDCEDCGAPIPLARQQALAGRGCLRCVDCQDLTEKRGVRA